ncbi:hypothetical protein D3C87_1071960 [compost metagenome]
MEESNPDMNSMLQQLMNGSDTNMNNMLQKFMNGSNVMNNLREFGFGDLDSIINHMTESINDKLEELIPSDEELEKLNKKLLETNQELAHMFYDKFQPNILPIMSSTIVEDISTNDTLTEDDVEDIKDKFMIYVSDAISSKIDTIEHVHSLDTYNMYKNNRDDTISVTKSSLINTCLLYNDMDYWVELVTKVINEDDDIVINDMLYPRFVAYMSKSILSKNANKKVYLLLDADKVPQMYRSIVMDIIIDNI